MRLYNTLTKSKEEFVPIEKGKVKMYTCGPTVYDFIHIGNLRSYLLADTLRRTFECAGYEVRHIKNITDVGHLTADDVAQGDSGEDKMLKKARAEHKTPEEIARFYEEHFHEDEATTNILPAHYFPRATAHVPHMIKTIETLINSGHAYVVNGNVFFDVTSFEKYGALSGNTLSALKVGARLEEHPDKRHPWDFALWLAAPADHLMHWPSPWSEGYPGWHIECSSMSQEYLGDTFDIHTGGEDNIFPHHEAEIAQSESASGKPFVRYWLHARHLLVDGTKMSKSKGNFYRLADILEQGFSAMDLRICLLGSHYRSQMNFTWDSIEQAHKNRITLFDTLERLQQEGVSAPQETPLNHDTSHHSFLDTFIEAMEDDLNTPLALAIALQFSSTINTALDHKQSLETHTLRDFERMLFNYFGLVTEKPLDIPADIVALVRERDEARQAKDFARADQLRDKVYRAGYNVEDTATGPKISPQKN